MKKVRFGIIGAGADGKRVRLRGSAVVPADRPASRNRKSWGYAPGMKKAWNGSPHNLLPSDILPQTIGNCWKSRIST